MSTGRFIWHQLLTRDVEAARTFYGRLFSWKTRTHDLGELGPIVVIHDGARETGAFVVLSNRWIPSHWTPFVAVDSIEQAAKAVVFWGGDITGGPLTIPGAGEILMIKDNQGAALSLLEVAPGVPELPPPRPRVGSFCSYVLNARDPDKSVRFYTEVFGWRYKVIDGGDGEAYPVFIHERTKIATLQRLPPDAEYGGYWLSAIGVKNLQSAHQRAVQLGARSLAPPKSYGKLGSADVLQDPTGAVFSLYEPSVKKR